MFKGVTVAVFGTLRYLVYPLSSFRPELLQLFGQGQFEAGAFTCLKQAAFTCLVLGSLRSATGCVGFDFKSPPQISQAQ